MKADKLIAEAEELAKRRATEYGLTPVDRLAYHCGLLAGTVRQLCAEVEVLKPIRSHITVSGWGQDFAAIQCQEEGRWDYYIGRTCVTLVLDSDLRSSLDEQADAMAKAVGEPA